MKTPRDFFEKIVKPSYQDWRDKPLAEHRARALFSFANDMAEWMYHHLRLKKKFGERGEGRYREELHRTDPDFGLLKDIANGTKHVWVTRRNPMISNAGQTGQGALTWDKSGDTWEDADYTWEETGDLLITTTDSGEQRSLFSIAKNVMLVWERLLNENGL